MLAYTLIGAALLLLALGLLYFYLTAPPHGIGRDPRRPGYIQPSPTAYGSASPTTAPTRTRTATSTACKTDGLRRGVMADQAMLPAPNRTTAHTCSFFDTASARGDLTTGAEFGDVEPPTPAEMSRLMALGYFGSATGVPGA